MPLQNPYEVTPVVFLPVGVTHPNTDEVIMATKDFYAFAGIRNTLSSERLERSTRQKGGSDQRTDLTDAVNIDLDSSGRASRRAGQTQVQAGDCHSIWAEDNHCLFMRDGGLFQMNEAYATRQLAGGLTNQTARYVSVNDRVYWSNGTQNGVFYNGRNHLWGMQIPEYQPDAQTIAGQMPAGTYQYAMTHLRGDGLESGTGMAVRADLGAAAGLRFFWDAPSDPDVTHVAVYLTQANGETLYRAFVAPAGQGSADYIGGVLALALTTQWLDAPLAGQDVAYSRGRIYTAVDDLVYATAPLGYEYMDRRDYIALDGTTVRFVIGVEGGLYVGTEKAVYFLRGETLQDLAPTTVVSGFGVAGSAINVDGFEATNDKSLAGRQCAMFATEIGVFFGSNDGAVSNLTLDRFQSNMARIGSAVLRTSDSLTQYLLTMRA